MSWICIFQLTKYDNNHLKSLRETGLSPPCLAYLTSVVSSHLHPKQVQEYIYYLQVIYLPSCTQWTLLDVIQAIA